MFSICLRGIQHIEVNKSLILCATRGMVLLLWHTVAGCVGGRGSAQLMIPKCGADFFGPENA
jgi:hypothetical protein